MKTIFIFSFFVASIFAAISLPPEYSKKLLTDDAAYLKAVDQFIPDIKKELNDALQGENYELVLKEVAEKPNSNEDKSYAALYKAEIPNYPKINALCLAKVDITGPKFLKEMSYNLNCTVETSK